MRRKLEEYKITPNPAPGVLWNEHVETGVPLVATRTSVARWPLRVAYAL